MEVTIALKEYKFKSALAALADGTAASASYSGAVAGQGGQPVQREDERTLPDTWTVKRGDTLWDIACQLYGNGTKWREIAWKNGISDPRKLQVGKVLVL